MNKPYIYVIIISLFLSATAAFAAELNGNRSNGENIFKKNCAGCHGATGEGNGPAATNLNPKPANFASPLYRDSQGKKIAEYSDKELIDIVLNGRKGTAMPSWRKMLSRGEIIDVLTYETSLGKERN